MTCQISLVITPSISFALYIHHTLVSYYPVWASTKGSSNNQQTFKKVSKKEYEVNKTEKNSSC